MTVLQISCGCAASFSGKEQEIDRRCRPWTLTDNLRITVNSRLLKQWTVTAGTQIMYYIWTLLLSWREKTHISKSNFLVEFTVSSLVCRRAISSETALYSACAFWMS